MHSVDRGFDPAAFLDGAEKAFRIIVTAFAAGDRDHAAGSAVRGHVSRLRAGDRRAGGRRPDPGQHHPRHPQRHDRERGTARAGRLDHGAFRLRPDQPDAGQGWPSGRRHGRGDRDHRPLDLRAEPLDPRSGVAVGVCTQRLMLGARADHMEQVAEADPFGAHGSHRLICGDCLTVLPTWRPRQSMWW